MIFTREDILKIQNALLQLGRKDSEFKNANTPLNSDDEIAILQNGINKKVSINNLLSTLGLLKKDDFINVSDRYDEYYIQLSEAITIIANNKRKKGLVITFQNLQGNWKIFQFDGELNNFGNTNYWKDLFDFKYPIVNSVLPDEEDLTASTPDKNGNSLISLKDKVYDPTNFSGKGYKILRKNIIDDKNVLTQNMINKTNTIYEIRYEYDLNGEIISIPENSALSFVGGSLKNGKIVFNNTIIEGNDAIFDIDTLQISGTIQGKLYTSQFGYYPGIKKDISPLIKIVAENGYILQFDKGIYYISETHIQKSNGFSLLGANKIGYNNNTTIISPLDKTKSYHYLLKLGGMKDFTKPSNYNEYSVHDFVIDGIFFHTVMCAGLNNEYADMTYNSQACGCLCLDFCVNGYLNVAFEGHYESLFLANTWEIRFEQIKIYGSYINYDRSSIYFGKTFSSFNGSNISAIIIDNILAEALGGSLLATSTACNAEDVSIGTIAVERGTQHHVYKEASQETINYILTEKDNLKKVPLLNLQGIEITIGKISDASSITTSCTVYKENDEEFITNNLRINSSNVTIANFNITSILDFWELAFFSFEPQLFVANLNFAKTGYLQYGLDVLKSIYVIQTNKRCGTVQIGNHSGRIFYNYDSIVDISNKYIDSTNIRRLIPDVYAYNLSILYKLRGKTLNGTEKDIVGVHLAFDLKLKANPKQVLILYLMASWTNELQLRINYYKNEEIVYTQTKSFWITHNIISSCYIPLSDIEHDYFIIEQFTNIDSRFIYAIRCVEQSLITGSTGSRPADAFMGLEYYDTTLNKKILWNGTTWVNIDGSSLDIKKEGTTEERPTNIDIGFIYKDTTLNKLIIWDGSKWVNLDGTEL